MARRVRFNKRAIKQILNGPETKAAVGGQVSRIAGQLNPKDYGSAVESGGDRVRGAVWTKTAKAKRATARDGELLRAFGNGGGK